MDFLNITAADPAIDQYPLMQSPVPLLCIVLVYILTVFVIGPMHMKNRKPYDLKLFLTAYNLFQVFICTYIVIKLHQQGFSFANTWQCMPTVKNRDWVWYDRLNTYFVILLVKAIELIETVIFVLRKKYNQITFLHVYHHITTVLLFWWNFKVGSDDHEALIIILNCYVHIVMYSYYFLALFKGVARKIAPFKPFVTIIQLVQFFIILGHIAVAFSPGCDVNKRLFLPHLPNTIILITLFINFYRKTYNKSVKRKSERRRN